ncbi:MAG TPA: hypothetical protein VNM39_10810 [Verrucomicrobiae bacterium]|nr:hypothetical protein [Verrucomicrobiae bacterium]
MSIIALDFDGVLSDRAGQPMQGALDYVRRLTRAGHEVFVHSARANYPGGVQYIRDWLLVHEFPFLTIEPKPLADVYVDDRAVTHRRDWNATYINVTHAIGRRT